MKNNTKERETAEKTKTVMSKQETATGGFKEPEK